MNSNNMYQNITAQAKGDVRPANSIGKNSIETSERSNKYYTAHGSFNDGVFPNIENQNNMRTFADQSNQSATGTMYVVNWDKKGR